MSSGSSSPSLSGFPPRARSSRRPVIVAGGGGGAVAAVQLARLAGKCLFFTALGDDELGRAAERELSGMGVRVAAAWRREPQRRAFVMLDADAERTITTIGRRLEPRRDDPLPWEELRRSTRST